jgi:tetratricopeptide (TPR) repeat protein
LINDYPAFLIFDLFAARACFEAGKFADAASYYEKAYKLDPNLSFAPYRLGVCHNKLGNKDEAVKWFKIAMVAGQKRKDDRWGREASEEISAIAQTKK